MTRDCYPWSTHGREWDDEDEDMMDVKNLPQFALGPEPGALGQVLTCFSPQTGALLVRCTRGRVRAEMHGTHRWQIRRWEDSGGGWKKRQSRETSCCKRPVATCTWSQEGLPFRHAM